MSVNNLNHEHCRVCGEQLVYVGSEKTTRGSLLFYACPKAKHDNDHDRAVYEVGPDVEIA